ncbi:polysaccharide deacetylase family protein [Paenibacillus sp. LjRoot56]|uniref:polysaccharide deacetylase family protein n=1 Tax=Paenibacillus sp. LjRoot56 TaxID=3342333 RepID=UPI003ECC60D2
MRIHLHDSHYGSHIIWSILIGLLVYTIIPTAIVRLGSSSAFRKGKRVAGIALTFDDGPDPAFTPQLLDLLKLHGIQATFFILGAKAEKYPEIIRRMHAEGHLIGIHNLRHWINAVLTPKKVRKQLQDTVTVIDNILGFKPIYYRPPWGIINLFDFLHMKQFQLVLWSLMVGDWRCSGGTDRIKKKLFARLQNNDIIVLHDSGQTLGAKPYAPMYMMEALKDFVEECRKQGIPFMRIDQRMQLDDQTTIHPIDLSSLKA